MRYCITGTLSYRRNPRHRAGPLRRPFPRGQTPRRSIMQKFCGDSSVKNHRRKVLLDPSSLYPKVPQMSTWLLLAPQQISTPGCLESKAIWLVNLQLTARLEMPQIWECMNPEAIWLVDLQLTARLEMHQIWECMKLCESQKRDHLRSISRLRPRRKPPGKLPCLRKYKPMPKTS